MPIRISKKMRELRAIGKSIEDNPIWTVGDEETGKIIGDIHTRAKGTVFIATVYGTPLRTSEFFDAEQAERFILESTRT